MERLNRFSKEELTMLETLNYEFVTDLAKKVNDLKG